VKGKVLVIDDEGAIRKSLRMVLEYEGYDCVEAPGGPDGIETLRRESPDAVLLDIKMPGMDGLEVLQAVRGRTPCPNDLRPATSPTAVRRWGAYDSRSSESTAVLTALRTPSAGCGTIACGTGWSL
jgi:CheY-like chemotaxis protein